MVLRHAVRRHNKHTCTHTHRFHIIQSMYKVRHAHTQAQTHTHTHTHTHTRTRTHIHTRAHSQSYKRAQQHWARVATYVASIRLHWTLSTTSLIALCGFNLTCLLSCVAGPRLLVLWPLPSNNNSQRVSAHCNTMLSSSPSLGPIVCIHRLYKQYRSIRISNNLYTEQLLTQSSDAG